MRSATSALENSSSKYSGFAERQLLGNRDGRFGSEHDRPLFKFTAGKQSLKVRFLEAAIHHRVLTTLCGHRPVGKADAQNDQLCGANEAELSLLPNERLVMLAVSDVSVLRLACQEFLQTTRYQ